MNIEDILFAIESLGYTALAIFTVIMNSRQTATNKIDYGKLTNEVAALSSNFTNNSVSETENLSDSGAD